MLYGAECWPTKRRHIQELSVADMHMLCWIYGHTRLDRVRNDDIYDRLGVAPIKKRLFNTDLNGLDMSTGDLRGTIKWDNNVKRCRGRPNLMREEAIKSDLK
jgi:hypothetical protein